MATTFLLADVGRDIVGGGGVATITGYTNPQTVTATILQPFPVGTFDANTWAIAGTPQTTLTPAAKSPVGTTTTLTLGAAGWRAEDVGKYVRVNGGLLRITAFTSTTIVDAVILVELTAVVAAPALAWTLEGAMWGGAYGYPRCGTLHEQRLWLAGSIGFPQGMWGSAIGAFLDFTISTLDDDGIAYVIAGGETAPILHLITVDGLVALTTAGMFSVQGGNDAAITPTNIRVREASAIGCAQPPPAKVGNEAYV
ncbi:MAG: hypothetical protein M3Q15_04630, partial [Pseudomonadota bacterium]|nr:hypothetical protein [Pseudomonadota bacterium]